ncbi:MAG: OmpA family protein [Opitutaceae bacterium]|nr:OmpA family protein [Opitutaceae bacterium]
MKLASHKLSLVVASAALVFAGCTKKPTRPDPASTVLGPSMGVGTGTDSSMPVGVIVNPDAPGLTQRTGDWNDLGQNRTALKDQAVYFDFDQSAIKPAERAKLKVAKEYLDKNPGYRVVLEGHCDWRGTAEYNLGLGDRRANSVKKYLQSLGVPADRVETISKGSLEANKDGGDAVWAKDRRVDLVVVNPTATTPAAGRMPGAL